ncbi:MAG: winged helix-turn-helix domain-containing protein [Bryobacteraceae bacterium]
MVFGDFRLDASVLEHRGTLVPLAPKAQAVLHLLVSRAPATVTKEEIFENVWPGTYVVESSLARNISLIRKALEERESGPFIETIPKRGYRFVAPLGSAPGDQPPAAAAWTRWVAGGLTAVALAAGAYWWGGAGAVTDVPATEQIAQHLLTKGTPAEAAKALRYFEQAVRERPQSANAHGGLAQTLTVLPQLAIGGPAEFARAREEARAALELDPKNAAAHTAMGTTLYFADWDFGEAERWLKKALELDHQSAGPAIVYAQLLATLERWEEAAAMIERARAGDPVSPLLGVLAGRLQYDQGRFEAAAAEFEDVLERERHFSLAHYYLALANGFLGRYAEADRHFAASELQPGVLRTDRAWLSLRQGDRAPAVAAYADLRELVAGGKAEPGSPLLLAVALGDLDAAFSILDQAYQARSATFLHARTDPRLDALRRHPRYAEKYGAVFSGGAAPR